MINSNKILLSFFLLIHLPLSAADRQSQEVVFKTEDGGIIHSLFYEAGKQSVILAHGAVFNKESWQDLPKTLTDNDFSVLALDFRGYGASKPGDKGASLDEDILAAIRYLLDEKNMKSVSVIGASMGGGAAAKASIKAKKGALDKLILISPPPVSHPEQIQGKILFIASKDESMIRQITTQYEKAPEPKQLQIIEGSAHAQHIFKTAQGETLTRIILDFLSN